MDFELTKDIQQKMKIIVSLVATIEDIFDTMDVDERKVKALKSSFVHLVEAILIHNINDGMRKNRREFMQDDEMKSVGDIIKDLQYKLEDDE